ncbi:FecR family protein [Pseudobacter ginsenosidimutans]|nr:FecR family protein [Pseudobacter ginsenosidimutans]
MERFLTGSMSEEERKLFLHQLSSGSAGEELDAAIGSALQQNQYAVEDTSDVKELVYRKILKGMGEDESVITLPGKKRNSFVRYWWVAALLIIAAGVWMYPLLTRSRNSDPVVQQGTTPAIMPGTNGAVLTLADGSTILLDSLSDGIVTTQDGISIRLQDHQLMYGQAGDGAGGKILFNTMSTPRGKQFKLVLPDGTRVWMNAASSIRYPARFGDKTRDVEITGELFFEVAKDRSKPFRVLLDDGSRLEVLGTSFNINAYEDEGNINTTLIDGSVRVESSSANAVLLKPLQQAELMRGNKKDIRLLDDPDIEKITAWKNGAFDFSNTSLGEMMRQLSRWYNITVEYPQGIPALEFEGKMSRNITLNGLLKILDQSGVHFRLEDTKLIVLP